MLNPFSILVEVFRFVSGTRHDLTPPDKKADEERRTQEIARRMRLAGIDTMAVRRVEESERSADSQ